MQGDSIDRNLLHSNCHNMCVLTISRRSSPEYHYSFPDSANIIIHCFKPSHPAIPSFLVFSPSRTSPLGLPSSVFASLVAVTHLHVTKAIQINPTACSVKLYATTCSCVKPAASVPNDVAIPPARTPLASPASLASSSGRFVKVARIHCATTWY